jgi:hypothetical protein
MTDRSPVILFAAKTERWEQYEGPLRTAFDAAGLGDAILTTQADPAEVDYIVYAPNSGLTDFTPYTRLKAVLNLWAGVEDVTGNATLEVPLARMVDDGLTEGMVEWVTGHVLRHHLGMDTHIHGQDGVWRAGSCPTAGPRPDRGRSGPRRAGRSLRAGAFGAELPGPRLVSLAQVHRRCRDGARGGRPRRHAAAGRDRRAAAARHPGHGEYAERAQPCRSCPGAR